MQRDQCPHPHLFFVGDGATSNCGLQGCDICPTIAKFDAEILKAHDTLVELSKQRSALKNQINYHHKPLINRLPFELLSEIFTYIVEGYSRSVYWQYGGTTPIRLGGVCQMWRNITLGTPRLWTTARIKVKSCGSPYKIDVAKEWLRRSHPLPLSMAIEFVDCSHICSPYGEGSPFDSSLDLLRSHSTRWSRIDIKSNRPYLLHRLLNGLQDSPPADLESLSVGWCRSWSQIFDPDHVLLPRSISQDGARLDGIGLWDLPCGFERLTHMDMSHVPIDEVLYFIQNAPNLEECRASLHEDIGEDDDTFPLPTSPIVAQHLTLLETTYSTSSDMFQYLTLPSLRSLEHEYYTISRQDDFDSIIACLERSSPPLEDFNLKINILSIDSDGWYELLPAITSLTLNMTEIYHRRSSTQCHTTEDFLAALARRSGTLVLPNLKSLCLIIRGMSEASWSSLCEIFQDLPEPNPAESQEQVGDDAQPSTRRDLLKKIEIHQMEDWERHFAMEEKVFERFENLKNAGVELKVVFNHHGPKFGRSASMTAVVNHTVA